MYSNHLTLQMRKLRAKKLFKAKKFIQASTPKLKVLPLNNFSFQFETLCFSIILEKPFY